MDCDCINFRVLGNVCSTKSQIEGVILYIHITKVQGKVLLKSNPNYATGKSQTSMEEKATNGNNI